MGISRWIQRIFGVQKSRNTQESQVQFEYLHPDGSRTHAPGAQGHPYAHQQMAASGLPHSGLHQSPAQPHPSAQAYQHGSVQAAQYPQRLYGTVEFGPAPRRAHTGSVQPNMPTQQSSYPPHPGAQPEAGHAPVGFQQSGVLPQSSDQGHTIPKIQQSGMPQSGLPHNPHNNGGIGPLSSTPGQSQAGSGYQGEHQPPQAATQGYAPHPETAVQRPQNLQQHAQYQENMPVQAGFVAREVPPNSAAMPGEEAARQYPGTPMPPQTNPDHQAPQVTQPHSYPVSHSQPIPPQALHGITAANVPQHMPQHIPQYKPANLPEFIYVVPKAQQEQAATPHKQHPTNPSSQTPVPTKYKGRPVIYWSQDISRYKREGDLDQALTIAKGCIDALSAAAPRIPADTIEFFVTQAAIIQHKQKDFAGEVATLEAWVHLDGPTPREEMRLSLIKRLAKARESLARQQGEDPSAHKAEWKRYVELEKAYKEQLAQQAQVPSHKPAASTAAGKSTASNNSRSWSSKKRSQKSGKWIAPREVLASPTFVAVDFETANKQGGESACQVALVKFSGNQIVERFSTLLKPPCGYDYFEFTYLHGIGESDVRDAPTWADIAPAISQFCGDLPVYAHNAAFDARVWRELDTHFGTHTLPTQFYCSYRTAQKMVHGLDNYKLPTVVKALVPGYELDHHKADSDAEACALIIASLRGINGV
ncbi:MAG: exonuclease domain-containing protein [Corynebacterium sp.]|nr:exonuclease domain-containing protein [Corynebacterium sp.]